MVPMMTWSPAPWQKEPAQDDAAADEPAQDEAAESVPDSSRWQLLMQLLMHTHLPLKEALKLMTVCKAFSHAVSSALASRHEHSCVFSKRFWTSQERRGWLGRFEQWLQKNGKSFHTLHICDFSSDGQQGSSWPPSAVFGSNPTAGFAAVFGSYASTAAAPPRHTLLLTQLASPQLRDISLTGCIVQLGPHSGYNKLPGVLHGLSGLLTKLQLRDCRIADRSSALAAVATLTNLQHLGLQQVAFDKVSAEDPAVTNEDLAVTNEALQQTLAQLAKLQRLDVKGISDTCGGPVSMIVLPYPSFTAQGLAAVQHMQQLTMLLCGNDGLVLTSDTAPYLSALTALQHFEMTRPLPLPCGGLGSFGGGRLEAAMLRSLPQLQHLELSEIQLLSDHRGGTDLLAALRRMTNLTTLILANLHVDLPARHPAADASVYTSLTASSKLVKVDLFRGFTSRWLPDGLWERVLPAGRHLPHLRDWSMAQPASGQDLARLVSACPGLQRLELTVQSGADLAALQAATNLQALEVRDDFPVDTLTSLTGLASLRRLVLRPSKSIRRADFLVVTTLRQLTAFELVRESCNSVTVSYTVSYVCLRIILYLPDTMRHGHTCKLQCHRAPVVFRGSQGWECFCSDGWSGYQFDSSSARCKWLPVCNTTLWQAAHMIAVCTG